MPQTWDIQADVVVVGFGAAGACAALEAASAGRAVAVLDRFRGGSATALSGGVVYAGGGTPQQREAGVRDSPEAMFDYLSLEVGDAVSPATLRAFCAGSPAMLAWLERHGVPFEGSLCPDKTSYPTNRYYLYYSGSELSARGVTPPAPRGHRVRGRGTSGGLLLARLAEAVRGSGVRVLEQTSARQLVTDATGQVIGVECLPGADAHPRRACGRGGDRPGTPGRRSHGARAVRRGPQRGRAMLALLRQRALTGRLRLLRAPRRAARRGRRQCPAQECPVAGGLRARRAATQERGQNRTRAPSRGQNRTRAPSRAGACRARSRPSR